MRRVVRLPGTIHKEVSPAGCGVALCGAKIKRVPVGFASVRFVPRVHFDIRAGVNCQECIRLHREWLASLDRCHE